mgnify:CR=1 FL=1
MNHFKLNYDNKILELNFEGEVFNFDLNDGDVGDFWHSFTTKDGVLKSTDKVSIEVNNGKIIINGQALTDEQNAKYSGLIQKK